MTTSNDFFQTNEINGALTPQQAAELLEIAASGDTSFGLDDGGAPASTTAAAAPASAPAAAGSADTNSSAAAPAPAASPAPAPAPAATPAAAPAAASAEPDASNAVVLAKDGKHTIPYEKLVQAREGEQHWRAQAETAQRQLTELQARAQQRADAGQAPTQTDNQVAAAQAAIDKGVDPAIFGDFSEEALAKGIQTLVAQQVQEQVQAQVGKAMAPYQQQHQLSAREAHYDAIYKAHPDADSMAESAELQRWIGAQPSYVQPTLRGVLEKGTSAQVVELFNDFKKATAAPAAAPAAGASQAAAADPKAAAQAVIAAAAQAVPSSLSDIPGGRADALSPHERLAAMDPASMAEAMQGMSPEQIDAFLNRSL
ncbi:hypothetical protein ABL840_26750 [Variovorax sp. NFACC27]|uniref:hypothetical protein n=1 Tax=unclassified Variovorax TaxID=663243 RepID=UPI00089C189C|nr:hypothetical protein SAMN03159371_03699 [Variovorax sp. NFACC28]SEG78131.1 hypothetical protein SAMN03159365_03778 [Variovorax sp. NFACC29]SFC95853.1 hypothetical protein SAMN03159379_03645 [Variovorax sp. NFACC26]SFG08975.1 hypothetical protein SAMN03159447_01753 [Variovorax sp. NFACC27]